MVLFPFSFKELLAHADRAEKKGAVYLFESSWKKKYTDLGIRKILKKYSDQAGMVHSVSPPKLRHFLLTWLKKQGIDDALIQPYSGHASRKSLEVYSKLTISDAQGEYERVIPDFPV
ncbi:site-specific integrase [Paenactinomyces guangxiensis]|uniref:Site-specific integrase n=1 Tax=Paenactinomyces guangxiensis TaxID=1490290 RepID=A0A7W1WRS6_9BACL|nr:site-specific integrase [Paenactinomyces guangxiensis]MBH8591972.1 site-specific integrase [Paenactinomyces guangxiensis]